jgi:hypothetical protein
VCPVARSASRSATVTKDSNTLFMSTRNALDWALPCDSVRLVARKIRRASSTAGL